MQQGSDSFRLIVRRGPQPNQTYELTKDRVTLGRDITNDITINDPEVSRHHMQLIRGAGGYTIEDLGSTNGTFVNGQRLTSPRPLRPGDMIGLGETVTLAYEVSTAPSAMTPGMVPGSEFGGTVPGPASGAPRPQPYTPSAPSAPSYQPPAAPGPQPSSSPYGGGGYSQSAGYGSPYGQPSSAYSPPAAPMPQAPPGYGDYDPYAVREEEPRSTARWILIGCVGIALFCCCTLVIGAVLVDQLCLWDRLPIIYDVLRALGMSATC